jgi:hypothetical protein
MKKIYNENRVIVLDGVECLNAAAQKTKKFVIQNKLKLKNRELLNFMYHFFIVDVFKLISTEKLKFRSTIVFYDSRNNNQLLEQKFFELLVRKIKKTCPLPIFTVKSKGDADIPHAAERCLQKDNTRINAFYKTIYKDSLTALQNFYVSKVSLFS